MGKRLNLKNATTKEIIAFSMLPMGMFFINSTVYTVFNVFMTDVLKLSMTLASVVILGTKLWDAINDPLMGTVVEKTRSKWGKCRPYLIWMTPPLVIITALLFAPLNFPGKWDMYKNGEFIGNAGNFVFVLIMYMLFITAYTGLEIPFNSMTPLVFPQKDKRVSAVSWSQTIGSLGTVLPTVFIWLSIGMLGNGKKDTTDWGYFWSALIFALAGAACIIWSFFGIKEKVYIPPRKMNSKKSFKVIFTDSRMIVLLLCALFSGIINVGAMFLPYFANWNCIGILPMDKINLFLENLLGKNPQLTAVSILPTLLSVTSGIAYMLSMMIVPPLLKKMSKKTLWIGQSLIGGVMCFITYFVGVYVLPYNTLSGFIVYAVLRFFTNFPVGMSLVLLVAMFADITDDLEIRTDERLEATAYSMKGLLYKISVAVFNVVVLVIIDKLGYNAEKMAVISENYSVPLIESTKVASVIQGVNYTELLNTIFFMMTALGAIGMILQAIPMFFYKFDENAMSEKLEA
ncbi:MAG: MFS transporter, partial [Clostridia bacterium]|nr:MFS transporter [Clostridia bacterium]